MMKRIKKVMVGMVVSSSILGGMNATGCAVDVDEACVVLNACGDTTLDAVQSFELKQVAIY
jgi:hypothetical protein